MKKVVRLSVLLLGIVFAVSVFADEKEPQKKPKIVPVPVYLGNSDINGGEVPKQVFDSLLKQGFTARDSNGRQYKVSSFMFTFCERMIYEDSIGNLMPLTDYLSEYCFDNKLLDYQLNTLLERGKRGDTLILEQIKLTAMDSTKAGAYGKALRIVITR